MRESKAPAEPPWAPGGLTLDLGAGVTMELVLIPPGEFVMGSPDSEAGRVADEGPRHRVTISQPFYMGGYPGAMAGGDGEQPILFQGRWESADRERFLGRLLRVLPETFAEGRPVGSASDGGGVGVCLSRGGYWNGIPSYCRSAGRDCGVLGYRTSDVDFRCSAGT